MAEIDKALPNVKQKLNIPSPEDIQVEEEKALVEQKGDQPIDVQQNEDSGNKNKFIDITNAYKTILNSFTEK